jgi:hypothetical protein
MNVQQNAASKMQQQNSLEKKSPQNGNSVSNHSNNSERLFIVLLILKFLFSDG